MKHDERCQYLLDEIDNNGQDLTDWEVNFIDKMMKKGKYFTKTEKNKLEEIYEERC